MKPEPNDSLSVNSIVFTHEDVNIVVDKFYNKIQKDEILSIPFQTVHDWPEHIEKLTHFWWIRLGGRPYLNTRYNPVEKHFLAGFNEELLARWLRLFGETMLENLTAQQMEIWFPFAQQIGRALAMKNEFYKSQYGNA